MIFLIIELGIIAFFGHHIAKDIRRIADKIDDTRQSNNKDDQDNK